MMEKTYVNSVTQRQASTEIKKLRLDLQCGSLRGAVDSFIHRLNTYAVNCPVSDRTDDAMINILTHCTQSVEWARPLRQALISKNVVDFDDACDVLSALATDEDITLGNTGSESADNIHLTAATDIHFTPNGGKHHQSMAGRYRHTQGRPAFDNRRLGTLHKAVQSFGQSRSNPRDRKTGKIMVCRSQGCGSTTHFQYSGKCPVEQERRRNGTSAIFMASCIEEDLARGEDILGIFCEVLFSKTDEEGLRSAPDDDFHQLPPMPLPAETAKETATAGYVDTDTQLGDVSEYMYSSNDDVSVNYFTDTHLNPMDTTEIELESSSASTYQGFCEGRF